MIRIGICGLGTVGGGVIKILKERAQALQELLGDGIEVVAVMSRRDHRLAELGIDPSIHSSDFDTFLKTPMDIMVEVIGGDVPAESILKALDSGIKVVTANKALLATRASEFLGHTSGHRLFFEASSCGGIPIVSTFEEGLLANRIDQLLGIFNGTCNFVLTQMEERGCSYEEVLKEAQELGYAEADPTFDVEGYDATHKLCLLGSLAFGAKLEHDDIPSTGITKITAEDFNWAKENGFTIKLISMGQRVDENVFAATFPCLIPLRHPMANVDQANNAVFVQGNHSGPLMFYGAGAGEFPTASAVVSDIIAAAQGRDRVWARQVFSGTDSLEVVHSIDFPFYIRFVTPDEVGVLSRLCECFGRHGISLKFVHQNVAQGGRADLTFTTHPTRSSALEKSLEDMGNSGLLIGQPMLMRMLDF